MALPVLNLLTDPMVILELAAIAATLTYLVRIVVEDIQGTEQDAPLSPLLIDSMRSHTAKVQEFFANSIRTVVGVGAFISAPKRSLRYQRVRY